MHPLLPSVDGGAILESMLEFLPELLLCVAVVFLLLLRLFRAFDKVHLGSLALVFTLLALGVSVLQWLGSNGPPRLFEMGGEPVYLRAHSPGSRDVTSPPPAPEFRKSMLF